MNKELTTYKSGDVINLNHGCIFLSRFNCGHTQRVEVKVGRKKYLIDVKKDVLSAFVEMYPKIPANKSKYSVELLMVHFRPDAILDRKIIENFKKIEDAQRTLHIYGVGL